MSGLTLKSGTYGQVYDAEAMRTELRLRLNRAKLDEALMALGYMWRMHAKTKRADGQPYAVHPMKIALELLDLRPGYERWIKEETICVALLHDVSEEEGIPVKSLPFNRSTRRDVGRMTVVQRGKEPKFETRRRAAKNILKGMNVAIVRALDRKDNLSTMPGVLPDENVCKNVAETDQLILPMLRQMRERQSDLEARQLLAYLIDQLQKMNNLLALAYCVKLTDPNFVNSPMAVDYTHLLY